MLALCEPTSWRRRSRQGISQEAAQTRGKASALQLLPSAFSVWCFLGTLLVAWLQFLFPGFQPFPCFYCLSGSLSILPTLELPSPHSSPSLLQPSVTVAPSPEQGTSLYLNPEMECGTFTNCAFLWQSLICVKDCLGCPITASFLPPGGALNTQEIERTQHGCGGLSAGGSSEAGVCRTEPGAVQWW